MSGELREFLGEDRGRQVAVAVPCRVRDSDHHALVRGAQLDGQVVVGELLLDPLVTVYGTQGRLDGGTAH